MKKSHAGLAALIILTATTAILAVNGRSVPARAATQSPSLVTVVGSGTVTMTPTTAEISVGVNNQAPEAQLALARNNSLMNQVLTSVQHLGIPASALATTGLNINPVYNQNSTQITAYQVSDSLTITTSVSKAGQAVDAAVAAGANQVNGINFTVPAAAEYHAAYRSAVKNAASQADAIATSLGEHVLRVKSVTTVNQAASPQPFMKLTDAASAPTPILPGQSTQSLSVKVVYVIGH